MIYGYEDQFSSRAYLENNYNLILGYGLTFDQVFPFAGVAIFLSFNDLACQKAPLNVKDAQLVIAHLFFGMKRHHILTKANLFTDFCQDAFKHNALQKR